MTLKQIKARYEATKRYADSQGHAHSLHMKDIAALIEMVEALQHLGHPTDDTRGLCPLVLYFANEKDREEMKAAALQALPNARAVKIP